MARVNMKMITFPISVEEAQYLTEFVVWRYERNGVINEQNIRSLIKRTLFSITDENIQFQEIQRKFHKILKNALFILHQIPILRYLRAKKIKRLQFREIHGKF